MNQLLLQYAYLQALDLLTTIAFLLNGVREANPVVRLAFGLAPSPLSGLLMIKVLAIALGILCWRSGRVRTLSRVNLLFAALIAWNLTALILQSLHIG